IRPRFASPPVERFIDDGCFWHSARVVTPVEGQILARAPGAVSEVCVAPDQPPADSFGVGIEQQLVRIEAVPSLWVVGTIDAVTVELTGRNIIQMTVPDAFGMLGQCNAFDLSAPLAVKQA